MNATEIAHPKPLLVRTESVTSVADRPSLRERFARILGDAMGELRDIVNPLQHLPLVSGLYRVLSKDDISPTAKLLGGGLYGGPIGAAVAAVEVIADRVAGTDLARSAWGHVLSRPDTGSPPASRQADSVRMVAHMRDQAAPESEPSAPACTMTARWWDIRSAAALSRGNRSCPARGEAPDRDELAAAAMDAARVRHRPPPFASRAYAHGGREGPPA